MLLYHTLLKEYYLSWKQPKTGQEQQKYKSFSSWNFRNTTHVLYAYNRFGYRYRRVVAPVSCLHKEQITEKTSAKSHKQHAFYAPNCSKTFKRLRNIKWQHVYHSSWPPEKYIIIYIVTSYQTILLITGRTFTF